MHHGIVWLFNADEGMNDTLLAIRDLKVAFHLHEGVVRAVNGVTLEIPKRRTLGLVGESGCGKSV